MDPAPEILASLVAGFSFVLAGIGFGAGVRYRDGRFALVAAALAVLGVVGALSVVGSLAPGYAAALSVPTVPLGLLVVAVTLLYLALIRGRPRRSPT